MTQQNSIPFSLNSGNIKRDIKAIKNWVDADLKYQIWSLNTKIIKHTDKSISLDKKEFDLNIPPVKKETKQFSYNINKNG